MTLLFKPAQRKGQREKEREGERGNCIRHAQNEPKIQRRLKMKVVFIARLVSKQVSTAVVGCAESGDLKREREREWEGKGHC